MEIDLGKIDSKYLKISYLSRKEEMSRRDILFGLLKPHYEVVPAVDEVRCTAWRGCALCLACPQEAISLKDGAAYIDKDKCTACGACLPSCPQEAISSPLLDPEILDASLQSLLCQDGVELQPRVLLITSQEVEALVTSERGSVSPRLVEVRLPCMGALSPWLLLRSLDLGATGVGVIPCNPICHDRCQPGRWQPIIRFVRALLVKLGIEPERIEAFSSSEDGPQSSADFLQAFVEKVKQIGPTRLRDRRGSGKQLNLIALLKDLRDRLNLDGTSLSGDEVPFGIVRVNTDDKTCTLCGACPDRCPTGAITLQEGPSSQLLFDHSRCIACGACVKVCPEQVLRLEKKLDFSRLGVKTVLAEDRMAHCQSCGKEIAPLAMMRKIQDQLGRKKGNTSVGLAEFCPDCRIFGSPPSEAR